MLATQVLVSQLCMLHCFNTLLDLVLGLITEEASRCLLHFLRWKTNLTWYSWWVKLPPSGPSPSFFAASRWAWCRRQAMVMAATRMPPMQAMATSVENTQRELGWTRVARGNAFASFL